MSSFAYLILVLFIGFGCGLLCAALMVMAKGRDDETS
jgi:hypothetical protein